MFGCQYSAACILKVGLCHPKSWASSQVAQSSFLLLAPYVTFSISLAHLLWKDFGLKSLN
jgi:hypothetical protein